MIRENSWRCDRDRLYSQMIRYIGDTDTTTRRMLEEILAKEEEHAEDLSDLLAHARSDREDLASVTETKSHPSRGSPRKTRSLRGPPGSLPYGGRNSVRVGEWGSRRRAGPERGLGAVRERARRSAACRGCLPCPRRPARPGSATRRLPAGLR